MNTASPTTSILEEGLLLLPEFDVVSPAIVSVSVLDSPEADVALSLLLEEVVEPSIAHASPNVSVILSKTFAMFIFEVYPVYLLEVAIIS